MCLQENYSNSTDTWFSSVVSVEIRRPLPREVSYSQCKPSGKEQLFDCPTVHYQPLSVDSIKKAEVSLTFTMPVCSFWMEERPWIWDLALSLATPCCISNLGSLQPSEMGFPLPGAGVCIESTDSCVWCSSLSQKHRKPIHLLTLDCRPHSENLP